MLQSHIQAVKNPSGSMLVRLCGVHRPKHPFLGGVCFSGILTEAVEQEPNWLQLHPYKGHFVDIGAPVGVWHVDKGTIKWLLELFGIFSLANVYLTCNSIDTFINHIDWSVPLFLMKTEIVRINHNFACDMFCILYRIFSNGLLWKECAVNPNIENCTV